MIALIAAALASAYVPDVESVLVSPAGRVGEPALVVVDGWKRTGCDEVLAPAVAVDAAARIVRIGVAAASGQRDCMPVMTRFSAVVTVGDLALGSWRIVAGDGGAEAALTVAEARERDEPARADITTADVETRAGTAWTAVLSGRLDSGCERLGAVRLTSSARTFELVPLVESNGRACTGTPAAFVKRVSLPDPADAGRYLLSVRGAGDPVSVVFSVGDLDIIGHDGH